MPMLLLYIAVPLSLLLLVAPVGTAAATCLAQPITNGSRSGGDYANHPVTGAANASHAAELCRAVCCADERCDFWGLDVSLPTKGKVMNCSHGQMCCWQKSAKGVGRPSGQCAWGCFNGATGRAPEPPPRPPAPAPRPPAPPALRLPSIETECTLRQLALEYAMHLQPQRDHQQTHDALRLKAGCNMTFQPSTREHREPAATQSVGQRDSRAAGIKVHVALTGSDATGDGSVQHPFATLHRARDAVRTHRSSTTTACALADVVIGEGTYHLGTTLELGVADSHTRFLAAPGAVVVLSGGEPLKPTWQPAGAPFPPNVHVANVGGGKVSPRGSAGLTSLFVNGERRWRARTPNGDPRSDFTPENMFEGPAATPQTNQLSEEQIKGIKPMPVRPAGHTCMHDITLHWRLRCV